MKIYVDADACPVKDVIIFEATNVEIPVTLVTSFSHYSNAEQPKGVETIYVDSGADAADYRIMQLAKRRFNRNARLRSCFTRFSKGCIVLHHKAISIRMTTLNNCYKHGI